MDSILSKTTNLVKLYLHTCGDNSDIPQAYHLWSCLSMIGACVADRVYFHRIKEWPIYPNMYVFLIGESGSGKNFAINKMEEYVQELPLVNYRRLRTTAQYLLDMLGKPTIDPNTGQRILSNTAVYLSMPEISAYIQKGEHADTLIQMMTELYSGTSDFTDGTRMHGETTVRNCCINWITGSTKHWLLKAMTPDTVLSGFFARIITVYPEEEKKRDGKTKRVWDDVGYPEDYDMVVQHIKARVMALTTVEGEMFMTEKAHAYVRQWNANRPEPTDELIRPWWKRQREAIAKIAMILCLADGRGPVIRQPHVSAAIKILGSVESNLPDLIDFSQHTPSTEKELAVKAVIKRRGKVGRTDLARTLSRTVNSKELSMAIVGLRDKKLVREETSPTGGKIYVWEGG